MEASPSILPDTDADGSACSVRSEPNAQTC
jgi:hypothetical protein